MYAKILVPVDGSPTSDAGLDEAIRLARAGGGALRLLHVIDNLPVPPMPGMEGIAPIDVTDPDLESGTAVLTRCAARASEEGVDAETVLVDGVGNCLVDCIGEQVRSWGADVIVLGTHGRRGLGRMFLGSDAERVVRVASVPVLLVRHAEETSQASSAQEKAA